METKLSREEKINRYSGVLEFPSALKVEDKILYINKKGNPTK